MDYEIADSRLAAELEGRYIGYRKGLKYYVDVLQAAYLTEIGKCNIQEAVKRVSSDARLRDNYVVFAELRKNLHVCSYSEGDDVMLVHEKGMVPRRHESAYLVKVLGEDATLAQLRQLRDTARRIRKTLIIAVRADLATEYYKFQEVNL